MNNKPLNPKYIPTPQQISTYIAIEKCVSFGKDKNSQKIKEQYYKEAIKTLYMRNYMRDYMRKKRQCKK